MQRVIVVDLAGQRRQFRLHEDAYDALRRYLDGARVRLGDDPDAAEVLGDLERSIGDRLAALAGSDDRVLDAAAIGSVLDAVGAVDAGAAPATAGSATSGVPELDLPPVRGAIGTARTPRRRRLYRIHDGQQVAGVCTGLAAFAGLDVAWVRTIFVLLTLVTAGAFLLVYLVLMFILPVAANREEWLATMVAESDGGARSS